MAYTKEELEKAVVTISSLLHKCEKAQQKILQGTSQWTLLNNRINALYISLSLIHKEREVEE